MTVRAGIEVSIGAVRSGLDGVVVTVARVAESVADTAAEESARGHDGVAGLYRRAGELLAAAVTGVELARDRLDEARDALARTRGEARVPGQRAAPGPVADPAVQPETRPGVRRARPDKVAAVRRMGRPRNRAGRVTARGVLVLPDGTEPLGPELKALNGDRMFPATDLKPEYRTRDVTISWHIEGGVARWLRRNPDVTHAELYLNIPPCGGSTDPPDPRRCAANLRAALPNGTVLTVWIVGQNKQPKEWTFVGTGEAMT